MRVTSIPFSAKYSIYLPSKVTEYFEELEAFLSFEMCQVPSVTFKATQQHCH